LYCFKKTTDYIYLLALTSTAEIDSKSFYFQSN